MPELRFARSGLHKAASGDYMYLPTQSLVRHINYGLNPNLNAVGVLHDLEEGLPVSIAFRQRMRRDGLVPAVDTRAKLGHVAWAPSTHSH